MPSISPQLARTRSARWYQATHGAQQRGAWAERVRCYTALSSVCADHAGGPRHPANGGRPAEGAEGRRTQPPIELSGLLTLVADRAHFAGAEPVYRRYRHRQDGQPTARWAGPDPSVKPNAALVAEAKIASFWPYREGVIEVGDAFDMSPAEWGAAYLRALAAWAADDVPLAACRPAGAPECTGEDMAVLAAAVAPAAGPADARAARLRELAGAVVQAVLDDASITPLGAFNIVRDEVHELLTVPPAPLADRLAHTIAELSDQLIHADPGADGAGAVLSAGQAGQLRSMVDGLATLLAGVAGTR